MFDDTHPIHFQKVKLEKRLGQSPEFMYQNNNRTVYRKLNNKEYYLLLEQLRPNNDFALPDRMVQDLVHDNKFIPKFIESRNYSLGDLIETIKDGNEMTYLEKKKETKLKREKKASKRSKLNKRQTKKALPKSTTTREKLKRRTKTKQRTKRKRKN